LVLKVVVEVASGCIAASKRAALGEAIGITAAAKREKWFKSSSLCVARSDRLARELTCLEMLKERQVLCLFCDQPELDMCSAHGLLILSLLLLMAQHEARLIRDRTAAGRAVAARLRQEGAHKATVTRRMSAWSEAQAAAKRRYAARLRPELVALVDRGLGLSEIAREMRLRDIPTMRTTFSSGRQQGGAPMSRKYVHSLIEDLDMHDAWSEAVLGRERAYLRQREAEAEEERAERRARAVRRARRARRRDGEGADRGPGGAKRAATTVRKRRMAAAAAAQGPPALGQ